MWNKSLIQHHLFCLDISHNLATVTLSGVRTISYALGKALYVFPIKFPVDIFEGNDHLIQFHLTFSVDRNFLLIWAFDQNFYFFILVS